MIDDLLAFIAAHGDRGAVVPISRVDDLRRDMEQLRAGSYHTTVLDTRVSMTDRYIPADLPFEPRSVIVVVTPSPKLTIEFNIGGRPFPATLPPSYADMGPADAKVLEYIRGYLSPLGHCAEEAIWLPLKPLATHCGLALYGRNNIGFNDEFGSYMRILAYFSDIECGDTFWRPLGRLPQCDTCHACVECCPTGAIDPVRDIIDADICLTWINERPTDFPDWLSPDAHNCLVGCLKCQDCCPLNADNRKHATPGGSFDEAETAELLAHVQGEPYSEALEAKIAGLGIARYADVLPRNLAALLR